MKVLKVSSDEEEEDDVKITTKNVRLYKIESSYNNIFHIFSLDINFNKFLTMGEDNKGKLRAIAEPFFFFSSLFGKRSCLFLIS